MLSPQAAIHMTQFSWTRLLRNGLRLLAPLSVALTVYLYLYPIFNICAFPLPPASGTESESDTGLSAFLGLAKLHSSQFVSRNIGAGSSTGGRPDVPDRFAPFRLLALGDPQLEGDTSIPNAHGESFPHLTSIIRHVTFQSEQPSLRVRIRQGLHDWVDFLLEDIPNTIESVRKRIDLVGNDFYLAHIYRTLHWWTRPTHITVLGDLVGSQWLDEEEFNRRADRYWSRVFRGAVRVPDEVAREPAEEYDLAGYLDDSTGVAQDEAWMQRIINVVGNHDIGYAGDINEARVARFERAFGRMNYELRFERPLHNTSLAASIYDPLTNRDSNRLLPELRVVVLNDVNLDTPAASTKLQDDTYAFINGIINTASAVEFTGHFTLVLTHVPMHKPAGTCVDDPFFDFHEDGTLREQNMISDAASRGFLEGIFGMSGDLEAPAQGRGRSGIILNGHDHEGCDTWHFINQTAEAIGEDGGREWEVRRWRQARSAGIVGLPGLPGLREITVRSMMGDYGGNAGLLSLWFDEETWEWRYEYAACPLGTQHLWWVVHVLDVATVVVFVLVALAMALPGLGLDVNETLLQVMPKPTSNEKKEVGMRSEKVIEGPKRTNAKQAGVHVDTPS